LNKSYPSLYEFLVRDIGYSSSSALRRIESARLLREVPDVAAKIESGALNLSQLSKVQQAVRSVQKIENRKLDVVEKKELLNRIEHTTQQQTEVILCQALSLPALVENKERTHRDESVTLTITFNKEQMAILKQAQDLIAHAVPDNNWAEAVTYLANKEIQRRTNLRNSKSPTPATGVDEPQVKFNRKPLRATVKKIVLNQQKCCQFKDRKTGKICGSTRFLQIDHRQAVWAGGTNEIQNLQILCSQHNQYKYRQESFLD
jgi:hypothetical protein